MKIITGKSITPVKKTLSHLLFWVIYYIYDGPIASNVEAVPYKRMISAGISLPVKVLATYFTFYLFAKFYNDYKKPVSFTIYMLISVMLFGLLQRSISYNFIYAQFYPEALGRPLLYAPKIIMEIFGIYSVVGIVATLHFMRQWYVSQQEKQQYKNEKLEAELKYLKAQIHPHFLFNTLNNLYALTIKKSSKAPEIVHKLSQLMSYMLYDSNKPFVPLQKEIDYIENYITLEKIRYGDRLDVSLNIFTGTDSYTIAPLLVLPFIENSFKHGFCNDTGMVWVHIDMLVNDGKLIIKVENSKSEKNETEETQQGGIGLQNATKRLDLIYRDSYELQIFDAETYLVTLKIDLPQ